MAIRGSSGRSVIFCSVGLGTICYFISSTMSSMLNAASAVVLQDYAKPLCCSKLSPGQATLLSKALGMSLIDRVERKAVLGVSDQV